MGVAKSTVYRTLKQYNETGTGNAFKHSGGRPGIVVTYDEAVKQSVRQIVLVFFYNNELPTLDKILIEIKKRPDLPHMCRSSLHKLMKQINFWKRLIVLHVGSEHGFVDGGLLLFESKKTGDYHEEMNSAVFEGWFGCLLPKLPDTAVIVMDNASYHNRKLEKIPTTSSTKKDMQEWLQAKQIEFSDDMVRSELLHLIKINKEQYNMYVIDEMARDNNKIVLRLPPYHCELNPMELIWAKIKNEVALENNTFKLKEVKEPLLRAIRSNENVKWKTCVEHVIQEEIKMCTIDGIVDDLIEPFIISVGADSDSDSISDISDLE